MLSTLGANFCGMACDAAKIGIICPNCRNSIENEDDNCNQTVDKCTQWLNKCDLSDESLSYDGTSVSADDNFDIVDDNVCMADKTVTRNNESVSWENITNHKPNHYKNIQIYKSQNVHIGNVTHIHGPVYINEFAPTINQNILINSNSAQNTKVFPVVPRRTWLAQPPLDPEDVKCYPEPPKFVIIHHSASEEAYSQTDNNLLVRLIQQFHVESNGWNDIGYNFLAGADGSIYEGRGWKVVGAHTLGYNSISVGICFIGCYMRKLPPAPVMEKVQAFIKHGVEIGAIAQDYALLAHCQCRSSENPGKALFEEIKTWDRWDGSVDVQNPSPLMLQ